MNDAFTYDGGQCQVHIGDLCEFDNYAGWGEEQEKKLYLVISLHPGIGNDIDSTNHIVVLGCHDGHTGNFYTDASMIVYGVHLVHRGEAA